MKTAVIDPRLSARVVGECALGYTFGGDDGQDRGPHVRAASGIAAYRGRYVIVQDDTSFLGIAVGGVVDAIALPRGKAGRRRFEERLGNKGDKLDLESCCVIGSPDGNPDGDALYAFGSGSTDRRETIVRLDAHGATMIAAPRLYAAVRDAVGGAINLEGAAAVGDELWLFHRGNCGGDDRGPAVVRLAATAFVDAPRVRGVDRYELGSIDGVPLGFTDAVADGDRVLYLAAAEASANAIDDGATLGTHLGVIERGRVRATPLALPDGTPLKAEGITVSPTDRNRVFVVDDPDDPDRVSRVFEVVLDGF
ncbi:MAG: hypothetical protein NT062_18275 [Proteobacteria bacterium]|nr:hypothetical protein [Pseudomonadota bacterium]